MKNLLKIYSYIAASLFTIGVILYATNFNFSNTNNNSAKFENLSHLGEKVPEVRVQNFQNDTILLSDLIEQKTYLSFTASWCAPCKKEYPNYPLIAEVQQEYSLLVISMDTDESSWRKAYEENNLAPYRIINEDELNKLKDFFKAETIPFYSLVSEEGVLLQSKVSKSAAFLDFWKK